MTWLQEQPPCKQPFDVAAAKKQLQDLRAQQHQQAVQNPYTERHAELVRLPIIFQSVLLLGLTIQR